MNTAVDLRSDTVTVPSPAMREAMASAAVGDDVFGEDPSVKALEARAADLTGMEAGLFVPSGTMGNQISLFVHCRPGDDVLVGEGAHSFIYESGGGAALAGVQFTEVGRGGHFSVEEMVGHLKSQDPTGHIPPTTLVMVENTHNRGGGKVMNPETFSSIAERARRAGAAVHLDGARLFNAAAASGVGVDAWTRNADTVSFCLSKGLGAPVGSVLCGTETLIRRAHRYRKMMGGGMRQAGIIAAAGVFALDNHLPDLEDDHRRARSLAAGLGGMSGVRLDLGRVETNIVYFDVPGKSAATVCEALDGKVRVLPVGPETIRAVLHRDIDDQGLERGLEAFASLLD